MKKTAHLANLAGSKELAEHLGCSRDSVKNRHNRGTIAPPVVTLACGPIWDLSDFPKEAGE